MKKLLLSLVLILLFPATSYGQTPTLNQQQREIIDSVNNSVIGERIEEFNTDITVNADGTINVKETIRYNFENQQRHGIFRYIPFTKRDDQGNRLNLGFENIAITNDKGDKYKFEKSKENEQIIFKIGDPDKTVSGIQTYVISYSVSGALGYFEGHDELYWNITGNGWEIPIKSATSTIHLPESIDPQSIRSQCYTGGYAETKNNCEITTIDHTVKITTTLFLNSNEGLTIVVGFPKGNVATLLPEKHIPFFERWYGKVALGGIIIASLLWYIILPVYLVIRWFQKGRDPYVGIPVTAMFEPPKVGKRQLTPAETGALLDEHVDKKDLFATIIDLARRGHLKILEPKEKEFHLTKTNPTKKDSLLPFEKTLLDGIFETSESIKLKEVKFYKTASKVETAIYSLLVEHGLFPKNPRTTRNIYYGLGAVGLVTFNFVLAFVAFVFGRVMPRKTLRGAQLAQQAQGLKNFLKSQERQLNFQGDKQLLFEKLLPIAIAFGVEKAWAKRFEQFNLKNPDWYQGSSRHFNSAVFASHLSNSYNSFVSSSTPPSSSSSSGFSGGSSGGGGGGGGGGSW